MQNSDATFQRIQDTLAQIAEQQRQADARSAEFNRELEAFRRQEEERSAVFNRQLDAFRRQTAAEEKQRKQIADAEMAEIRKNINNVSKEWGDFNNNEGERIEEEFAAALSENMQIGGIRLDEIIRRTKNRYEYDLVGINGSATVVGEVKRKITAKSVRDFAKKRLPYFGEQFPMYVANRKVYGMVGGIQITPCATKAAAKYGFFVLRLKNKALIVENTDNARPFN